MKKKILAITAGLAAFLLLGAASCSGSENEGERKAREAREAKAANVITCGLKGESQECINLKKKLTRDNDPARITYVYTLSWTGEFIGYYVVKGKVSSNQSQMGPMDQVMDRYNIGDDLVLEAPGDDGSYGPNEDGIFFFTTDDNKITWNGMYQQSDKPLNIKVPLLYGA